MDDLFNISIKEINDTIDWLSHFDMTKLTFGEQMLMMSAQAEMCKKIKPIMENHKSDLVEYKLTQVNHRK